MKYILILLVFMLGGLELSFAQTTAANYADIVQALRSTEVNPQARKDLVTQISQFPSSDALTFLHEIISLDPDQTVVSEARHVRLQMEKFLFQDDEMVLLFKYRIKKGKSFDFSLRKTVFEEKVENDWAGDSERFLRFYLLDKILEIEMSLHAHEAFPSSLYTSRGGMRLPSMDDLNRQIEKHFELLRQNIEDDAMQKEFLINQLMSTYPWSDGIIFYYGFEKVKLFLWMTWLEETKNKIKEKNIFQAKKEVLNYLIDVELGRRGLSRDDFSPGRVRDYYGQVVGAYQGFIKNNDPEARQAFLNNHPEVKFVIKEPRVKIQAVWFKWPSIAQFQDKDPQHSEGFKAIVQNFYQEIFDPGFLKEIEDEALSIFNLDEGDDINSNLPNSTDSKESHFKKIESQIDQQKKEIVLSLKDHPSVTPEKVTAALQYFFTTTQSILGEQKSESYPAAIAFVNAMQEAMGRYLATETSEDKKILVSFMSFCGGMMKLKIRDSVFTALEKRKDQFQEGYQSVLNLRDTVESKTILFQKTIQVFQAQYPAEFVFLEPDWIERGETFQVPEIEYLSFYADPPKQPADQEPYYFWNDPSPSLAVFQWVQFEEERLLTVGESQEDKNVGLLLQDFLFSKERLHIVPQIKQELFQKYRGFMEFYPTLDTGNDLDFLNVIPEARAIRDPSK